MIVDLVVRLAPQPASVAVARRMVTEALASADIDPDTVQDIRLAVSEACSNAVLHGPVDGVYEVGVHLRDDRCELVIRDGGTTLDAAGLPASLPPVGAATGRGLAIMRAVMDEVDVAADPAQGTVVRLVKQLGPRG
ncbi:MAG: ATP-binding protein [Actinomycetota bacterium]